MSPRVLIIDDDARLYALLEEYLSENDVTTMHAPDGLAGLELLGRDSRDMRSGALLFLGRVMNPVSRKN